MSHTRLKDIKLNTMIGNTVYVEFMAGAIETLIAKTNREYMVVKMMDSGVTDEGKIFALTADLKNNMQPGSVYAATVKVQEYPAGSGKHSCVIEEIGHGETPANQFVNWENGAAEAAQKLGQIAASMTDTNYGKIAYGLLSRHWTAFCQGIAGAKNHHIGLGGLATHTLEVLEVSTANAEIMDADGSKGINLDLLKAAAILHDIGKTHEIQTNLITGAGSYTPEAAITTHIMTGMTMVAAEAVRLGIGEEMEGKPQEIVAFERNQIHLLVHCVASHHGMLEWGSAIEPATMEAMLIHLADMVSSKIDMYDRLLSRVGPNQSNSMQAGGSRVSVYKPMSLNNNSEGEQTNE